MKIVHVISALGTGGGATAISREELLALLE